MTGDDWIVEALRASEAERVPVSVQLPGGSWKGVVTRLAEGLVELRDGPRRIVLRLDRVEAVVSE